MQNSTDQKSAVLIVGAGVAASEASTALRRHGFADSITVVGEEPYLPYQRPPLSKSYLSGDIGITSLYAKPTTTYSKSGVQVIAGIRVGAIDCRAKRTRLSDGRTFGYDSLILAVGGSARRMSALIPGASDSLTNLHTIRTIDDVDRLRSQFATGKRLVIIGAGYLGLELASVGIKLGLKVCVIECQPRVLARVAAPQVSWFFERVHREAGVDLRMGINRIEFETSPSTGEIAAVVCDGKVQVPADIVVGSVGMIPNTHLAREAGLAVHDGILVDANGRTSDPDVFAVGDCANTPFREAERIRLESVPNALEQARKVAATICGKEPSRGSVPWFWSDQFDLKLQIAGISKGHEVVVVRGSMKERRLSVLYLKDERLIAADTINSPSDFNEARALIAQGCRVDTDRIADVSIPLAALA